MQLAGSKSTQPAARVDGSFVLLLLSSLDDSVEYEDFLNITNVNLILILIIPYFLADYVKQAIK